MTVAAPPRRRTFYSTAELAVKWRKSEAAVRLLLGPLEETGFVVRRGDAWRASAKARRLGL